MIVKGIYKRMVGLIRYWYSSAYFWAICTKQTAKKSQGRKVPQRRSGSAAGYLRFLF
jgi:hypothetical protein